MRIIDLQERPRWFITASDLKGSLPDDYISMYLTDGGLVVLQVKHIINRVVKITPEKTKLNKSWLTKNTYEGSAIVTTRSWFKKFMANKDVFTSTHFNKLAQAYTKDVFTLYSFFQNYSLGEVLLHPNIGQGVVVSKLNPKHMVVLFSSGSAKKLVCGLNEKKSLPAPESFKLQAGADIDLDVSA